MSCVDVKDLAGAFVIEVGIRQAWPFVTFADNRPTSTREMRLYVDSVALVDGRRVDVGDDAEWMSAVAGLNGGTVTRAQVGGDGSLRIDFADGAVLEVSGVPQAATAGEPWWFGA